MDRENKGQIKDEGRGNVEWTKKNGQANHSDREVECCFCPQIYIR